MSQSIHDPQTMLFASDLGSVGNYDPRIPLAKATTKDPLFTGRLYLRATLDEIIKIRSMSKSTDGHHVVRETKAQYDE